MTTRNVTVMGPISGVILTEQTDDGMFPLGTREHPLGISFPGAPLITGPASAAGAAVTAAVETSLLPPANLITFPPNWWKVGRTLRITASGLISSLITTPGTARFCVKHGAIAVFDGLAVLLDAAAAHTNEGWLLELLLTCRAIGSGTTAKLWGVGKFSCVDILGVPATSPKATASAVLPWAASAALGAGFDSTAAQTMDLTFEQTASTGSITLEQYSVELVGG